MKPEKQWLAIAESCGRELSHVENGIPMEHIAGDFFVQAPDYLNDLNAMNKAEKLLATKEQQAIFSKHMIMILNRDMQDTPRFIGPSSFDQGHATASQRTEAFLRTIGKWTDEM